MSNYITWANNLATFLEENSFCGVLFFFHIIQTWFIFLIKFNSDNDVVPMRPSEVARKEIQASLREYIDLFFIPPA
jgi:hypothetical protein